MRIIFCILTALRVAFVGDPQVDSERELDYARRSVYAELASRRDLDLVIVLGDLVNGKPELVAPSEACLDSIGTPWFRIRGNHDPKGQLRDTCVVIGGIRFILMDNVRPARRGGYEGDFSESQKEWLRLKIGEASAGEKTVLCTHIPISASKGLDSLSNILAPCRDVMLVSGHTHAVDRRILEGGREELVAGAACGTWWRGEKDAGGIPCALMNCGAPRGYFVADFNSSARRWCRLRYKAVSRGDELSVTLKDGMLMVNVYGGSREGRVTVLIDGRRLEVPHHYGIAPEVAELIELNDSRDRAWRKAHREEFIPARRIPSPHLWAVPLGVDLSPGSQVTVIYRDALMRFRTRASVRQSLPNS